MNKIFTLLILLFLVNISFGQDRAKLVGHWADSTLIPSTASFHNTYNEIWGLAYNGREYAVIGSTDGTHFIDVTNPATLSEVAFVAGKIQGGVIIHRDYHDYGGYLYAVADEGSSSLQIIDYSELPNSVSVVYDEDSLIMRSHNIFIDEAKGKMYSLSNRTPTSFYAMSVYDLTTPTDPTFIGSFNNFSGSAIGHVHDAFVRNDTAFLNCGGDGLLVVDFSNTINPPLLGSMATYPNQGYNHSGWLNETGDYYYMADENHEKPVKVVQSANLNDLQVVSNFNAGATHGHSIPHNVIFHNDKVFVSYYYDGLQVFDVSNPVAPQRTFYYDTYAPPAQNSYHGAWGVYPFLPSGNILVSDMQSGLFVIELTSTTNTQAIEQVADVRVFPVPLQNEINIRIASPFEKDEVSIQLLDVTGKVIADFGQQMVLNGYNRLTLPIDKDLPKGMYILNMNGEKIQMTKKLVK